MCAAVKEEWKDRFYLQAEDYLLGLISVVNELVSLRTFQFVLHFSYADGQSRYCVNVVTMGNHEEPIRISNFVKVSCIPFSNICCRTDRVGASKDLFAGFSLVGLVEENLMLFACLN